MYSFYYCTTLLSTLVGFVISAPLISEGSPFPHLHATKRGASIPYLQGVANAEELALKYGKGKKAQRHETAQNSRLEAMEVFERFFYDYKKQVFSQEDMMEFGEYVEDLHITYQTDILPAFLEPQFLVLKRTDPTYLEYDNMLTIAFGDSGLVRTTGYILRAHDWMYAVVNDLIPELTPYQQERVEFIQRTLFCRLFRGVTKLDKMGYKPPADEDVQESWSSFVEDVSEFEGEWKSNFSKDPCSK